MLSGWKTLIFSGALVLAGFLQSQNWAALIPNNPTTVGYITMGVGAIVAVLRMITATPVGK